MAFFSFTKPKIMDTALRKIRDSKFARQKLAELFDKQENVIVIHYSCEGFYDLPAGRSPRITSIAAKLLQSGQTTSFSIHQVAERQGIPIDQIIHSYDGLERQMLDEFYEFVRSHSRCVWLHWNMRDINFGFQAIAHRYKVLGGTPIEINETNLVDLNRLLLKMYGYKYIDHPRLPNLIRKNTIGELNFLTGAEEAEAFSNMEYSKLHSSTLRKATLLAGIADRAHKGILKTNSRWIDIYGGPSTGNYRAN